MTQPVFEILPENIFFLETNLICEVSRAGFTCIFQNDITKKLTGLAVYNFEETDAQFIADLLNKIFSSQSLLHKKYKKNIISWSDAESVLLPDELYKPGENEVLLNTLYGDAAGGTILNDLIVSKKIYNAYRIPVPIHEALIAQFPITIFNHQYTFLIKQIVAETNSLKVIFYKTKFVIVLMKNGELQIIQTYFYESDDDVIYYLLKTCEQYNALNFPLHLCGVIDNNSDLFKKINFYFTDIIFDEIQYGQGIAAKEKELPLHYFTHLLSISSCV